jgi:hypothetical protein
LDGVERAGADIAEDDADGARGHGEHLAHPRRHFRTMRLAHAAHRCRGRVGA